VSDWAELINEIDYHHRRWYLREPDGGWRAASHGEVIGKFNELVPDWDQEKLRQYFYYRDQDAHKP
jgi:hypothetical protein